MSIRLRLTLLYTAILTLTLLIFSVVLYSLQAQDTLEALKNDLYNGSNRVAEVIMRNDATKEPFDGNRPEAPPPKDFDEFSGGEQTFQDLREREIVRILDGDGNLVASPFGREEDAIPLSAEGLNTLQATQEWWETTVIDEEEMLVYSRPVVRSREVAYIVQIARPLTERNRTLQSLATTLGVAGVIVVLLAFAVGWTLSGLTLRPIQRITKTAQKIGEERDFTRRVDYEGPEDEVGRLASTFNQMLSGLHDAYEKVEHSLEMQRNFVADVSHELRTPLTTLRGNLGLLRRKPTAEMQDDILVDMVDESDRLIRLVNDLLLLARADAGRALAKDRVDISSVVEESVRQAQQLDETRTISLDVNKACTTLGDRDAFKQVMLILFDNALKHSTSEINVSVSCSAQLAQIRVQDHGEGISAEALAHIFDRFYRGEESPVTPGFGLGLPIAKALVEGMGGEIEISSEVNKGTAVLLNFRVA